MQTLSQRLRQLRSWQSLTLARVAQKVRWPYDSGLALKKQASFDAGEMLYEQYKYRIVQLAEAYGITEPCFQRLLDEEYAWRISTPTATRPETLPRMARYLYKPLPEVAHNLFTDSFIVLDCETTGKDPHVSTQICEITILDVDGVVLLNSLINPGIHIPDELTANVHGISDEMVKGAPNFREIGHQVARLIDGKTVVIYNAGFDAWLLDRLFIENSIDMPDFQEWCLMKAYADFYRAPGKYGNYAWQKLSEACAQQSLEWDEEAHRTLADTTMTWRLLQKLAQGQSQ